MTDEEPGDGMTPELDLAFDSGALKTLREQVLAHAARAGLAASRASDVVIAVHELAANVIRHGAGAGRLRIWKLARVLRCQVEDGEPPDPGHPGGQVTETGMPVQNGTCPWHSLPGHGLWLVCQVADRVGVITGPGGTRATIIFDLP